MQITPAGTSEVAIFSRILEPDRATLSLAAARSILALDFTASDKERMRQLSAKRKQRKAAKAAGGVPAGQPLKSTDGLDDLLRAAEKLGWQRVKEIVDRVIGAPT